MLALTVAGLGAQTAPKASHPYLWKIEKAGLKPSWLFGTIHIQRPDITALPPVVAAALDQSDAVYTEIPADIGSMLALAPKMMLPKGQSLDKLLGAPLTEELDRQLKTLNPILSADAFFSLKAWAVAAMLLELPDQLKYPGAQALDTVIYQRGAAAHKEVGGIETPEEQFAVLDSFTDAEQVAMVKDTIRQLRSFQAQHRSMSDFLANLYLAGDLDALVKQLNDLDAGSTDPALNEKFLDRLLYRRNAIMAARMAKRLQDHPGTSYFFAVGSAHLQGDRGLIVALEKAGFRLTRVP